MSIQFWQKKQENKNMDTNIEHNTKYTWKYGDNCVRIWRRREMRMDD